ncbi:copper resistance protein NlpE [Aequorivita sp. H23M31]|uniref:Copper resistance protein NlpE n=1 Tax=Aequorivita ciconiae TaxID=2494375 RepID=A0A410G5T2_9FLAO|nr:copper resistance protein NlpE [Aequorivita sp. H23M31]QAA82600.1 copper resistance protein NlpE [Aequorivita sp. H23M31]
MKKVLLLFTVSLGLLLGCKNEVNEKEKVTPEGVVLDVDTTVAKPDMHNSENALDWAGIYEGTTPCADCEGIKTILELKSDNTYTLSMTYLGKPKVEEFKQHGDFTWDATGSRISLKTDGEPMLLKVGENKVWLLDGSGNVIDNQLADMFILTKTNS